jgi:predicted small lipoprotein YifL
MEEKMKKYLAVMMIAAMTMSLAGCGSSEEATDDAQVQESAETAEESVEETEEDVQTEETDDAAKSEGVMTYAEYMAADVDTEVVVETYVQAKQSWWEDKATVYTQDEDGAYFLYDMACSEEDYDKLTTGTKIKVTGYKSEWSGEIEIIDATFEIEDGNFVATAEDVTDLLGTDTLIDHQNEFVSFKDMTVEDAGDGTAYLYKWDGSGSDGDDLYFNVSKDGQTYTFTVESYLCDNTTEVYNTVKNLNVGDTVDMEGFLYWYEGVNPHITSVTVK